MKKLKLSIKTLPYDCLFEICCFLNVKELFKKIGQTCKEYNIFIKNMAKIIFTQIESRDQLLIKKKEDELYHNYFIVI